MPANPQTTHADEVARSLNDYEQAAVVALCDGELVRFIDGAPQVRIARLIDDQLLGRVSAFVWKATDFGLAVRRIITQPTGGNDG